MCSGVVIAACEVLTAVADSRACVRRSIGRPAFLTRSCREATEMLVVTSREGHHLVEEHRVGNIGASVA